MRAGTAGGTHGSPHAERARGCVGRAWGPGAVLLLQEVPLQRRPHSAPSLRCGVLPTSSVAVEPPARAGPLGAPARLPRAQAGRWVPGQLCQGSPGGRTTGSKACSQTQLDCPCLPFRKKSAGNDRGDQKRKNWEQVWPPGPLLESRGAAHCRASCLRGRPKSNPSVRPGSASARDPTLSPRRACGSAAREAL